MEKSNASLIHFYVFYIFDVSMCHDFESLHFSKCFPCPVYGAGGVCMRCMYVVNMCVCLYMCARVYHVGKPEDIVYCNLCRLPLRQSPSLILELG